MDEVHLMRLLRSYLTYYHEARTHLSLENQPPEPRAVEGLEGGLVVGVPMLGGLHHRYPRCA
jgi:hypothetical protein